MKSLSLSKLILKLVKDQKKSLQQTNKKYTTKLKKKSQIKIVFIKILILFYTTFNIYFKFNFLIKAI